MTRMSPGVLAPPHEVLTPQEWHVDGRSRRVKVPRLSHAAWLAPSDRPDPVAILEQQAGKRGPDLVPIRYGRMAASPFAYFRGAAAPMAWDLAHTPMTDIYVQCCGDAHLLNFGMFAAPDRRLVFDVNDFGETLPGPFEWDVKRLAASFAVAARDNGFKDRAGRDAARRCVSSYRTEMAKFAGMRFLEVWYAHLNIEDAIGQFKSQIKAKKLKAAEKLLAAAHTKDSTHALNKLTTIVDGRRRIISTPPTIVPVEEVFADVQADAIYEQIRGVLGKYRRSLQSDRRHLLEQFTLVQVARKVVGVGSVGTRAWILLMDAGDGIEPLFLQAKEAQPSVLAEYCGRSRYNNQGERVVAGQHLQQAESDIFLGWTRITGPDGIDRDFYVRQLKDWKFSMPIEVMIPAGMTAYARLCGWPLARAHARSGDRIALAAYLGDSAKFDQAIADFAETYADQNEHDYAALQAAVKNGKAQATAEI